MPAPFLRRIVAFAVLLAGLATPAFAQNNQQAAQLAVRIQQLEEQIRTLTGQVEGLQFQLTQMQTLIQRMQDDNEFRFQQLEGGGTPAGKTPAATDTGALAPGGSPQEQTAVTPPATPETSAIPADPDTAAAPDAPLITDVPMDQIPAEVGESLDPLVGTGEAGVGQLGPLNLDAGATTNPDAEAQFQAGYDAAVNGDYAFAEDQFGQFVELYPDDARAPDATVLLGEAMIRRGAYADAASVLTDGFTRYRSSARAPELLMRLGIALAGMGERDASCRTFIQVRTEFGNGISAAFHERLAQEEAKAECPPAG